MYANIGWSDSVEPKKSIFAETAVTITGGKFVNVGTKILLGRKDSPQHTQPVHYEHQVELASYWNVILSDTSTQRHWILDGATAILHLCHAWLASTRIRYANREKAREIWYPPGQASPDTAYEVFRSRLARYWDSISTT